MKHCFVKHRADGEIPLTRAGSKEWFSQGLLLGIFMSLEKAIAATDPFQKSFNCNAGTMIYILEEAAEKTPRVYA